MDRLFRENGQPFVVHRDRKRVGEIEGIKDQGTLILENPGRRGLRGRSAGRRKGTRLVACY